MFLCSFIINPKMNPFLHLFLDTFIFVILVNQAFSVVSSSSYYDACEPQTCGNGPNVSYPFWLSDQQESYFGYPNFKLVCKDKHPVLTISDDDYIVREIFYSNHSFLVANGALYAADNCPLPLHNLILDDTPFSFSHDHADFSFFYNCSQEPEDDMHAYDINYASNPTGHSFAIFHKELVEDMNDTLLGSCESSVDVPVDDHQVASVDTLLKMSYSEILEMGLVLNWSAPDCSNCETSGGRCGFKDNEYVCFCGDKPHEKTCDDEKNFNWKWKLVVGAISVGGTILLLVILFRIRHWISTILQNNDEDAEAFIQNIGPLAVKRYKYADLRKMTNSFKEKLGQGGYGDVYKGKLLNGCHVAVKVLKASKGNGEDFVNEVASISRTSHVNVVTLLGYCFEGKKKALVYELMPNGSLEKFIYKDIIDPLRTIPLLGLERLFKIATGIARGLEYLHRGCNTRILHFDIKPHNILLDEDFCPKISDFGLSKLCTRKESIISMLDARGTIGYIAPEVFSRNFGRVSAKSDVYSYGMMILEMVAGRKNVEAQPSHTSEIYFPDWIYEHLDHDSNFGLVNAVTKEDKEIARKMILVGLWCIQTRPWDRPSMSEVIDMLEGSIEALQIPPKPILSSPARSPPESSTLSTLS